MLRSPCHTSSCSWRVADAVQATGVAHAGAFVAIQGSQQLGLWVLKLVQTSAYWVSCMAACCTASAVGLKVAATADIVCTCSGIPPQASLLAASKLRQGFARCVAWAPCRAREDSRPLPGTACSAFPCGTFVGCCNTSNQTSLHDATACCCRSCQQLL